MRCWGSVGVTPCRTARNQDKTNLCSWADSARREDKAVKVLRYHSSSSRAVAQGLACRINSRAGRRFRVCQHQAERRYQQNERGDNRGQGRQDLRRWRIREAIRIPHLPALVDQLVSASENPQIVRAMLRWTNLNMPAHYAPQLSERQAEAQGSVLAKLVPPGNALNREPKREPE